MQMKKALLVAVMALSFLTGRSQIVINELNVSHMSAASGPADQFGKFSDWVELYNSLGIQLSLNGYYLTNDKNNLYKWKFPNGVNMAPNSFLVVFCSGRNVYPGTMGGVTTTTNNMHTNFNIEQCHHDNWIMLTYNGVVKDSILVRPAKADHTHGRKPDGCTGPCASGLQYFNIFTPAGTSFSTTNNGAINGVNTFTDYAATPIFTVLPLYGGGPATAGFNPTFPQVDFVGFDTVNFRVLYTEDGSYPQQDVAPCTWCPAPVTATCNTQIYDPGVSAIIPCGTTHNLRAICVPKYTYTLAYAPSFCETNTYLCAEQISPGFGVYSIVMDTNYFHTTTSGTVHVEYFENGKFQTEGYGAISKPIFDSWRFVQRGFDVTMNDERGFGCAVEYPVFNDPVLGTSQRNFFTHYTIKAAGEDNWSGVPPSFTPANTGGTHLRDAFAQTYAMKNGLDLDGMHYKPIKVYVNGIYNGIYEFREFPDVDYVNYYKKEHVDSVDILGVGPQPAGANLIIAPGGAGSDSGWVTAPVASTYYPAFNYVRNFSASYSNNTYPNPYFIGAAARTNTSSIMDYMIYNSYLVNTDLTKYNTVWWRGRTQSIGDRRWRYMMVDMNNILDLYRTPTTLASHGMTTTPCVYTALAGTATNYTSAASTYTGHGYMLQRMLNYAPFKNAYINRYMDLVNTIFRCDKMIAHLDYFRNLFDPEMVLHTGLFANASYGDWTGNMDTLKVRLTERCNQINPKLKTCLNLQGPYYITVKVRPENSGTVDYNSVHLSNFTWSGTYYNTTPPLLTFLKAQPIDTANWAFDHWEFVNHTPIAPQDFNDDSVTISLTNSDDITAVFIDKRADIVMPTAFTPNGDGFNDVFAPLTGRFSANYEFQIWNRWGQQVFRTNDNTAGWDGRFNGTESQTGVYAYLITYKNKLNENKILKGNVTLIR